MTPFGVTTSIRDRKHAEKGELGFALWRRPSLVVVVFVAMALFSCDREAQLRLNWFGERDLFIDLCCSCLARTSIPDAGVDAGMLVDDVDGGFSAGHQSCLLNQPEELCVAALASGGTIELQGGCVLDENSPCDYACNGVLGYLSDDG